MNKMNKKGFTLIEMLVVIAIIAILVSIIIPVVGDSTEKAREAKDASNIRAAITEVTAAGLAGKGDVTKSVTLTQTGNWEHVDDVAGIAKASIPTTSPLNVTYHFNTGKVTVGTVEISGSTVTTTH